MKSKPEPEKTLTLKTKVFTAKIPYKAIIILAASLASVILFCRITIHTDYFSCNKSSVENQFIKR